MTQSTGEPIRHPDESEVGHVTDRLVVALNSAFGPLDAARAAESFRLQVRDDFARGDVVEIRGWALSRTELRLCALAVLRGFG